MHCCYQSYMVLTQTSRGYLFALYHYEPEWGDRFQPRKIIKVIEHIGYSVKKCQELSHFMGIGKCGMCYMGLCIVVKHEKH